MGSVEEHGEGPCPEALVRAACGGDRRAFGELFRALYPRVHRTAWAMLGSDSEADDVAQEAFVKAWEKRARFNFQSRYSTWLHRIAVNCALDALRRRRGWRKRFVSLFGDGRVGSASRNEGDAADAGSRTRQSPESMPNPFPDPQTASETAELGALIEAAVNALPEEQRTVLVLREYEGYHYEEIARALKIPAGTVMSRLHLARKKLQTILTQELS